MTDDDKALVERLRDFVIAEDIDLAADRIEALSAENERLREALDQIAAPAYVSVGTHKHMHLAWREIACRRIDIARDVLGETK